MRRSAAAIVAALAAGLLTAACGSSTPLPEPAPLRSANTDLGFPMPGLPACTALVYAALRDADPQAIPPAAAQGADFTCGSRSEPLPLNDAVLHDAPLRVRLLLESGADPNARWFSHGDRYPMQEAVSCGSSVGSTGCAHRFEIVQLLLRHGSDPNGRWCPFESRRGDLASFGIYPCTSETGVTPLIMAALRDQADTTYALLDARADPRLVDTDGASSLDHAWGSAVFQLLLAAMFPNASTRDAEALRYLTVHELRLGSASSGPWNQTALGREILGKGHPPPPPPPPTLNGTKPKSLPWRSYANIRARRMELLLSIGADPNERMMAADWTPIALAIAARDPEALDVLLAAGADANARWCFPVTIEKPWSGRPDAGCQQERGLTPLMWASQLGNDEIIRVPLKYGADQSLLDWLGRTALDHAPKDTRRGVERAIKDLQPGTP